MIQLRHFWSNYFVNNFSSLVGFLRLLCLLMMVGTYSSWSVIIDRHNVLGIHFLMKYVLQQQFLYCFTWSSNQSLILNIFSFLFLQNFLLINSISLCFDPWTFCRLLARYLHNVFSSFWRSLLAVLLAFSDVVSATYRAWAVSCATASQITTWGTISTEICFGVSKERVRFWPHVF